MHALPVLLALHVLGGGTALVAGGVAVAARKGGRAHRLGGRSFAIAMAVGAASAFALSLMVGSRLLLAISVLTGFLILSGLRALAFRRRTRVPGLLDRSAPVAVGAFGAWLAASSASPADVTGLFFGAGTLALALRQRAILRAASPDWLLAHIAGMGGAFVATVTAFVVVNVDVVPRPVAFIVPALIGTAAIARAGARHARRGVRPA